MTKSIDNFLSEIKKLGLPVDTIYDIGAWKGWFSRDTKNNVFPNGNFILFEANPLHINDLNQTGFKYFSTALSKPGIDFVDFYDLGGCTGGSYYKETTSHYDNIKPIKLPCTTLDQLIKDNNLPKPNFIKIDTQGSELDILEGAKSVMDTVDLIYSECPIICYNYGAPDIGDYLDFFKKHGMVPVEIFDIHRKENIVVQVDIMFMKNSTKEKYFGPNIHIRPFLK
jgi:FkbM family methyltransferase